MNARNPDRYNTTYTFLISLGNESKQRKYTVTLLVSVSSICLYVIFNVGSIRELYRRSPSGRDRNDNESAL